MIRIIRMYLSSIAPQAKSSGHFAVSYIFLPVSSSFFFTKDFYGSPTLTDCIQMMMISLALAFALSLLAFALALVGPFLFHAKVHASW